MKLIKHFPFVFGWGRIHCILLGRWIYNHATYYINYVLYIYIMYKMAYNDIQSSKYLKIAHKYSAWVNAVLFSSTAPDNKSHSSACELWSVSACDFQRVLVRTLPVTYGDASSHRHTWPIPSPLPSLHRWYHTANCDKIPKRLSFTVKHVIWPCHCSSTQILCIVGKERSGNLWAGYFRLCPLIKYSWSSSGSKV